MKKEFIPYEQALALKELGFDKPCFRGWYKNNEIWYHPDSDIVLDNPTFSQAFRWFREKYNLFGFVLSIGERNYEWRIQNIKYLQDKRHFTLADIGGGEFDNTYEEAELECLKKLIEIVKNK